MNEIRVRRMLLAGLAMLVVWVVVEILVEQVIARILLGQSSQEMWLQVIELKDRGGDAEVRAAQAGFSRVHRQP